MQRQFSIEEKNLIERFLESQKLRIQSLPDQEDELEIEDVDEDEDDAQAVAVILFEKLRNQFPR